MVQRIPRYHSADSLQALKGGAQRRSSSRQKAGPRGPCRRYQSFGIGRRPQGCRRIATFRSGSHSGCPRARKSLPLHLYLSRDKRPIPCIQRPQDAPLGGCATCCACTGAGPSRRVIKILRITMGPWNVKNGVFSVPRTGPDAPQASCAP